MNFEEFWAKCGSELAFALATDADKKAVDDYKIAIGAIWNDARQILLMQIVLKLNSEKRKQDELHKKYSAGTEPADSLLRLKAAGAINCLGKLIVQLSEMKV